MRTASNSGAKAMNAVADAAARAASAGQVVEALIAVLDSGVDVHRCLAAQTLGRIGDRRAVSALIGALLDEDEDVRVDAATALALIGDPAAAPQLMENLLGDPVCDVKLAAIDGLVAMRDPGIGHWLERLLAGRDTDVVWDEEEFHHDGWDDWTDVQLKAVEGLARLGEVAAVPAIAAAIEDEFGQDLTESGFAALARLGAPGLRQLASYLDAAELRLRRRAVAALALSDAPGSEAMLRQALADPVPEIRLQACRELARRDPADPALAVLFADATAEVRAAAVLLCGARVPDCLAKALDDPAAAPRAAALAALRRLAGRGDVPVPLAAVTERLDDQADEVAAAAVRALVALDPPGAAEPLGAVLADHGRPAAVRLAAIEALGGCAGDAVPALAAILGDEDRQVRLRATAALGALARSGDREARQVLLDALRGLRVPPPDAAAPVPPPEPADEPAGPAAADAATGAGDAGDATPSPAPDAFPTSTLAAMLGEDGPDASRLRAETAGVELTREDMERLALARRRRLGKRVMSPTPDVAAHTDVRRYAAGVLGDLDDADVALDLVQPLSDSDPELRVAAADSLARVCGRLAQIPDDVRVALVAGLGDGARDVRLAAVRGLAAAGGPREAELLQRCRRDDDAFVRKEVVLALARCGAAGESVAPSLGDADPGVRSAAAQALAMAGGEGSIERLLAFALEREGMHCREVGRLLRERHLIEGNAGFLAVLNDTGKQLYWAPAIEALEEINRSE